MNQNELYHYGVLGMKWGKRKNYYGLSKPQYKASNGVTVGAPKNLRVAAFRKVQGTRVGGATLNGAAKLNTAVYGRGKNKNFFKNAEKQGRRETAAVREANQAHKQAINTTYNNIVKKESNLSRGIYGDSVYKKAAKNVINKGMDQKKAVSKAKRQAWRSAGVAVATSLALNNADKVAGHVKRYANDRARQKANASLARIGTMKLKHVGKNVYEWRM